MRWVGRLVRLVAVAGLLACVITIVLAVFGQIVTVPPLLLAALGLSIAVVFVVTLLGLMLFGGLRSKNILRSAASLLKRREVTIAAGLAAGFWLAAVMGISRSGGGQPSSTPDCPTALDDHGTITCVSPEVFHQALVGQQLMIAGAFGFFIVLEILENLTLSRLLTPGTDPEPVRAQAESH